MAEAHEDVEYRDYVKRKIRQGLDDADAGRVVSHADVKKRLEELASRLSEE